jgi:hypothetical protein
MEGENAAVVGRRLVGGLFLENRLNARLQHPDLN